MPGISTMAVSYTHLDKDYFDNVGITMPTIGAENKTYGKSDEGLQT